MTYGTTIRDLCLRFNPHALRIDEHRLVQFGVLQGIIRRICKVSQCVPLFHSFLFSATPYRVTRSRWTVSLFSFSPIFFFLNGSVSGVQTGDATGIAQETNDLFASALHRSGLLRRDLLSNGHVLPRIGRKNWSRCRHMRPLEVKRVNAPLLFPSFNSIILSTLAHRFSFHQTKSKQKKTIF